MRDKNIQNQFKENLIATLRAMTRDESLQVEFDDNASDDFFAWNQNLVSEKKVVLPNLPTNYDLPLYSRAAADMAAAYLLFHDNQLHSQKIYENEEQKIFDEFEKARVVCEMKNLYRGSAKNILDKIVDGFAPDAARLPALLLQEVFFNQATINNQQPTTKIFSEVKKLAQKTSDQKVFASAVDKILELLRQEKEAAEKEQNEKESQEQTPGKSDQQQDELVNSGQENVDSETQENFSPDSEETGEKPVEFEESQTEFRESDEKGDVTIKLDGVDSKTSKVEFKNLYKVYTTKFDEVVFPQKLVNKNELESLRDQLDLKMQKLDGISKKMTSKLKKKLLSKRDALLELDASRGILNRKKLTQFVLNPWLENIWINTRSNEYNNTALTILLDNSGSMRGQPIVMSAMACEIIAEILEKFAIKTEVIGFTTADWKGGKARKLWESEGRVKNPGRLNELRHIIYKHFNQSFKKSKVNLGLMLKEGILKENIDGEALLFARSRLAQRSEKRKILLVISDGTPVDDSTNSVNDKDILTDHLHHVINRIENESRSSSKIEIVAIGIGHSTEDFYRNQVTIKSLDELGDVMIEKISALI